MFDLLADFGIDTSSIVWYVGHAVLFGWFSVFIAPVKHADKANVTYFWAISFMTLLLIVSTACHAPRLFALESNPIVHTVGFAWAVGPICFVCLLLLSNISRRVVGYTIASPLRSLLSNTLLMSFAMGLQYSSCMERGFFSTTHGEGFVMQLYPTYLHCKLIESPVLISIPILLTAILLFGISEFLSRSIGAPLKFFQSRHRRHGVGWFDSHNPDIPRPVQFPMVPWFSLSLTTTAIQLLVSLKIFVGRLDIRHILNAVCKEESDIVFDLTGHDPWIDFMADGGDGFNSSYAVARMLAQPNLTVQVPKHLRQKTIAGSVSSSGLGTPEKKRSKPPTPSDDMSSSSVSSIVIQRRMTNPINSAQDVRISPVRSDVISLPRGSVAVHGGDLAYPRPSSETYRQRLVGPLEAALPAGPGGGTRPRMFLIPGNHDHYDGLESFVRYIIGRGSIGGWKLPQKSSYFALHLPKGWWILGMDIGLQNDVDVFQYGTFCKIIDEKISEKDRVIVLTHRPQWVSDRYNGVVTGELFHQLLDRLGSDRLAMRLAGDLHHYQRYSGGASLPPLVTSGGGGAFLHPTHVPDSSTIQEYFLQLAGRNKVDLDSESEVESEEEIAMPDSPKKSSRSRIVRKKLGILPEYRYSRVSSFPAEDVSRKLAWMNLVGFRDKNWGADIIFGSFYFLMGVSILPICQCSSVVNAFKTSFSHGIVSLVFEAIIPSFRAVYLDSQVSVAAHVIFFLACFAGAKSRNNNTVQRFMIALTHFIIHAFAAIALFCLVELAIEFLSQLAAGRDSVLSDEGMRIPGIVSSLDSPLLNWSLEWLLRFLDFPSSLIRNRQPLCHLTEPASRDLVFRYLWRLFPFYWIIATPVAAQIMGTYLFVCINWLGLHMNEAFSSLRIEDFKHFLRMFIDPVTEDLHVYVIGQEQVPKHWEEDPSWDPLLFKAADQTLPPSSKWVSPSRWRPIVSTVSMNQEPSLVDYFVVPKHIQKLERNNTTNW